MYSEQAHAMQPGPALDAAACRGLGIEPPKLYGCKMTNPDGSCAYSVYPGDSKDSVERWIAFCAENYTSVKRELTETPQSRIPRRPHG